MNILGQPFSPWVTEQINVRQRSLGDSTNLSNDNLLYQNSKTPWIRLASTVDVTTLGDGSNEDVYSRLLKFGLPDSKVLGDQIARNLILQGGTTQIVTTEPTNFVQPTSLTTSDSGEANFGLNSSNSLYNGAYGWGGLDQRGYVPMPGITGATVKYYNNGALSKATINFKCFSRNQLAMLDVLYMRPGYNLLLEFGWSQYLNNKSELVSANTFGTPALRYIFNPEPKGSSSPTHFDVLDLIQGERIATDGNYEGVFGKVTNFNWSFNPDGSYDCSTDLTGMGDMMESLKVNIKLPSKADNDQEQTEEPAGETDQPPLIANKEKTTLNKVLFGLFEQTSGVSDQDAFWDVKLPSSPLAQVEVSPNDASQTTEFKKEDLNIIGGMLSLQGVTTDEDTNASPQVYITFGSLIAIIQKYLLIYNEQGAPLFDFSVDFKNINEDKNYIVKIPGQFSSNPLVCLIPYEGTNIEGVNVPYPETALNQTMTSVSSNWNYNTYLGRLMHIYLNINHIATVLDKSPREEDGSLSLLSFLKNLISDFTQALGGINMISIKVDEVTGKIVFIENAPQRFDNEPTDLTFARINTFGVKPDTEGSFVRNIVMSGELGPKFASLIAIGSQISGNKLTANATGFANYNRGLIDRVIPKKLSATDYQETTPDEEEEAVIDTVEDKWNKQINKTNEDGTSLFGSVYNSRNFIMEDIGCLSELNIDYMNMVCGKLVVDKQLQSPSFLPFNLSFDLDGISGIKLFEKFLIDDRVLPPSYGEGNVDLLVKSLNHQLSPSSWVTQIDTQAAPHSKMNPVNSPAPLTSPTTQQNATNPNGNALPPPPGQNPPDEDLLRIRLTRIMDDGTQTLGIMDILDTDEQTVLYSLPTSELPWKGNKNSVSCVPADNFRVKSHVSAKHGRCFWLIGNEQGGYAFNKLFGNGYIRTAVLIHMFPKAPGWALGCIGPGLKFNTSGNQKGRQQGTGKKYLEPAKSESYKAMDKLTASLYSVGSFKMEIINQGGGASNTLPSTFNETVKSLARAKNVL
tara:strand:+ start:8431 stop:11502 length:3072 start_codon:yes stop_codon:yes gene_type:complete